MSRILPILFNTEMVRAILDNRKTVTRRVCKGKKCPICSGDILYVRETWAFIPCICCNGEYARSGVRVGCYDIQAVEYDDGNSISNGCFVYRADCKNPERICWRPSIHMPKEAARIWLKVTDVRMEHLQDITDEQAVAEGIIMPAIVSVEKRCLLAFARFSKLWNSTLKKSDLDRYGWDGNPWVWIIEFERCGKPEIEFT